MAPVRHKTEGAAYFEVQHGGCRLAARSDELSGQQCWGHLWLVQQGIHVNAAGMQIPFLWVQSSSPPRVSPFLPACSVFNPDLSGAEQLPHMWMDRSEQHLWLSHSSRQGVSSQCQPGLELLQETFPKLQREADLWFSASVSERPWWKVAPASCQHRKARWGTAWLRWAPQQFPEQGLRKVQAKSVRLRHQNTVILASYPTPWVKIHQCAQINLLELWSVCLKAATQMRRSLGTSSWDWICQKETAKFPSSLVLCCRGRWRWRSGLQARAEVCFWYCSLKAKHWRSQNW